MVRYMLRHFCPNFRLSPNSSVTHTAILSGKSNSQQYSGSLHMLACLLYTRERTGSHFYSRRHLVLLPDQTRRHLVFLPDETRRHLVSLPDETRRHLVSLPDETSRHLVSKDPTFTATLYNGVGEGEREKGEGRREGSAYGWCTFYICQRRGLGPFQGPP